MWLDMFKCSVRVYLLGIYVCRFVDLRIFLRRYVLITHFLQITVILEYDATAETSHAQPHPSITSPVSHMSSQCSGCFHSVISTLNARTGWFVYNIGNSSDNSDFPWYAYDIRNKQPPKGNFSTSSDGTCTTLSLMLCDSSDTRRCFVILHNYSVIFWYVCTVKFSFYKLKVACAIVCLVQVTTSVYFMPTLVRPLYN